MSSFLVGFGLGLFVAAQIGPVSLLIVRTVLRGNFRIGLAMAAAVALVDLTYATLGLAGLGRALEDTGAVRVAFAIVGGAVLVALGLRTMWIGFRARWGLETVEEVGTPRRAFATTVAATAFNPLTIALWVAAAPAAAAGGSASALRTLALLGGVGLGTLTWYTSFAAAITLARRRIGPRLLAAIDMGAGAGILGFGVYIGLRADT
jgi:putative LysE/RhtB family amino acid efflux pump